MQLIIDRLEENYAVVELSDGRTFDVPIEIFPNNVREGSIININIDEPETKRREKNMQKRLNGLFVD